MENVEGRDWKKLAQVDFKCLENEIHKITSNSAKIGEEKYRYKCRREGDVKTVFDKLFWIITPTEGKSCDYIGNCKIECKGYEMAKECKKCKGYWFNTDETFSSYYEMWKQWKQDKGGMDPDDSDCESNPFLRAIYYSLWGKRIGLGEYIDIKDKEVVTTEEKTYIYQNGFTRFRTSYLFPKMLWGGDVMNTIASYNDKEQLKGKPGIDKLCRECHQLGNFVLVPAYFNQWRGRNKSIKDQMDLSLYRLSNLEDHKRELEELNKNNENDDNSFSFMEFFFTYWGKGIDAKTVGWNIVKEAFEGWCKSNFTKYINMFFLWDYVEPNDNKKEYLVKDMKTGSIEKIGKINDENVDQYIANANKYIERRGLFMAAMLKIAVEFDERKEQQGQGGNDIWHVSAIYKYIVEKVFLTDKTYLGYKEVIETIKETIEKAVKDGVISTKIKDDIFDNILVNIEKLKEDTHDPKGND